ncbi:MAG: SRPBCC family protein [Novosphingobium sp.]|nr:SRPBCC family protein [Novosphingobium sp.]
MKRKNLANETAPGIAAVAVTGAIAAGIGLYVQSKKRSRNTPADSAPGFTARRSFGEYDVVGRSVTIARPRDELFAFWRDFANLAQFMENVERVQPAGEEGRNVWTIRAPAGQTVDIETIIAREEAGKLIAWRSVEGSDIDTEGRVTFDDAPGKRGTRVSVRIAYKPPAGEVGRLAAKLLGREPQLQARHDLRRFKMLMETGEIATSARRRDQTRAVKQAEKHKTNQHADALKENA